MSQDKLSELLERASFSSPDDIRAFFEELLQSELYLALDPRIESEKVGQSAALGLLISERSRSVEACLKLDIDGRTVFPVFSKEEFLLAWASGAELQTCKKAFSKLITEISVEDCLHLNPAQNVGKELSSWELSLLRQGKDSLEELVAELSEISDLGVELDHGDMFANLRPQFRAMFEVYPEIQEAFLIAMREGEDSAWKPLLGLKRGALKKRKLSSLIEELRTIADSVLEDGIDLVLVDDLSLAGAFQAKLFEEAKPFYYCPQEQVEERPSRLKSFSNLFSLKKG